MSDDRPRKAAKKPPAKTPRPNTGKASMAQRRLSEPPAPVEQLEAAPPPSTPPVGTRRARLYRIPVLGAIVYLIAPPRRGRPSVVRRAISGTSAIVALLGLAMFLYPVAGTHYPGIIRVPVEKGIEWSNLLSDLESNRIQDKLESRFEKTLAAPVTKVAEGEPLTRITVPKLGVSAIVVEGTSPSALKAGAGHYPQTPLPGKPGNVAIAGHRTTFGRPFNRVDELRAGDQVILTTPVGVYTYELTRNPWITHPADWSVVDQTDEALLTLTSCHPKGSANQRIIVRAKLVKSEARRAKAA